MAEITLVQAPAGTGTSATFSPAPVQGHLLIASVWNATGTPAVASGWHLTTSIASVPEGAIFTKIAGASESTTQTPTVTANCNMVIAEFSWAGGSFTSNLDQHSFSHHVSATPPQATSTAITPAQANCFAFAGWMSDSGGATDTAPAAVTGMTKATDIPAGNSLGTGTTFYQTNIGTGSFSVLGTWSGASAAAAAVGISIITPPVYASAGSGSAAPAGSQAKSIGRALSGGITAIGYLFGGVLRLIGTLAFQLLHFAVALSGSMGATGTKTEAISAPQSGSITGTGIASRLISAIQSGTSALVGAASRAATAILGGLVTAAGTEARGIAANLTASVTGSGSFVRTIGAKLVGSITPGGSASRGIGALLSGAMTAVGSLQTAFIGQTFTKSLSGSVTGSSSFSKSIGAQLLGSIAPTSAIGRLISAVLSGIMGALGTVLAFFPHTTDQISCPIITVTGVFTSSIVSPALLVLAFPAPSFTLPVISTTSELEAA